MDFDTQIMVIGGADGPTAIFLAGRFESLFCILALLIMVIFYGIYFAKRSRRNAREFRRHSSGAERRSLCGG